MSNQSISREPVGSEFEVGTTWRPDQGEHPRTITGKLVDVRAVEGAYGKYPLVELEQDDSVTWLVHAFRDVLRNELANCAPQIGDRITVSYGGKSERGYFRYRVRRADGTRSQVRWGEFSDDAQAVEPDVPVTNHDLPIPAPPTPTVSEQAQARFGDDVPWE